MTGGTGTLAALLKRYYRAEEPPEVMRIHFDEALRAGDELLYPSANPIPLPKWKATASTASTSCAA